MVDFDDEDEEDLDSCQDCGAEITEDELEVCDECGMEHCTYCTNGGICSDCDMMAQEMQDEEEEDDDV